MKKSLLLVLSICGACFLSACGGGSGSTPSLISVQLSSAASLTLDVNQSIPVTATASNAPTNQGFDWMLSCGGGNCGTITAHTASGAPATFTAPAVPLQLAVTITAKLTGLANSGTMTGHDFSSTDGCDDWTNPGGESQHSVQPATRGKRRSRRTHLGARWWHILTRYPGSERNGNNYRHAHRNQRLVQFQSSCD